MGKKNKIKCPYCGGEKIIKKEFVEDVDVEYWIYRCDGCGRILDDNDLRIENGEHTQSKN